MISVHYKEGARNCGDNNGRATSAACGLANLDSGGFAKPQAAVKSRAFPPDRSNMTIPANSLAPPTVASIDLALPLETETLAAFDRPLPVTVRAVPLLAKAPWVRTLGKLTMEVTTQGWRFPTP